MVDSANIHIDREKSATPPPADHAFDSTTDIPNVSSETSHSKDLSPFSGGLLEAASGQNEAVAGAQDKAEISGDNDTSRNGRADVIKEPRETSNKNAPSIRRNVITKRQLR